jgi:predicted nuclease with TOPRIM domain
LEDIKNIEQQRDSLKPLIERYKMEADSLMGVDSLYQIQIKNLKEKNRQLDVRLSKSKDSVLKYRNRWSESVEKYEWMKKNQKVPSNQQTLDFFKKY